MLEADDDALIGVLAGQLGPEAVTLVEGDPSELERFIELFRFAETPAEPAASESVGSGQA